MGEAIKNANRELTSWSNEEIKNGIVDEYGVVYSRDGRKLLEVKNHKLREYKVREGTEAICDIGFKDHFELESVKLPNSLKVIGDWAFENCQRLTTIDVPYGVTEISSFVFKNCGNLINVRLSAKVTSIGERAFEYCENLETIEFVNEDTSIGDNRDPDEWGRDGKEGSFSHHEWGILHENDGIIKLPESLTFLGYAVFNECRRIRVIELPSTIQEIKDGTFIGCYAHIENKSPYVKLNIYKFIRDKRGK